MYHIVFKNSSIGNTNFEVKDRLTACVSGIIDDVFSEDEFSFFILNAGGDDNGSEYRLKLDSRFAVKNSNGVELSYIEGYLLWWPELGEAVVELSGVSDCQFGNLFK